MGTARVCVRVRRSTVLLSTFTADVPEFIGSNTITVYGNLDNGAIVITCQMSANPNVTSYTFYAENGDVLRNDTSNTYHVTSGLGYQTCSCQATNIVGTSQMLFIEVKKETSERKNLYLFAKRHLQIKYCNINWVYISKKNNIL